MVSPALDLSLALDVHGLEPNRPVRAHLVAEVSARVAGVEVSRPPLSVVFCVDVSGSMAGPPLEHVIQSIERLVGLLEPADRVGIVAFSDGASEVAALQSVEAEAKKRIVARVRRLCAEGGTHMASGLQRAAAMMPPRALHERQVILLLSDGAPNRGLSSPKDLGALARSFRPDVSVSTLGYGAHHHEDMLSSISEAGAGRYHFIADPVLCELEFAQAIGAQGDAVAEAIELTLIPGEGVEIARFLGGVEARFSAEGLKVGFPDLLDGARCLRVAEVALTPPKESGLLPVLRASLSYRRAGKREVQRIELDLSVPVGPGAHRPQPKARARVLRARADEVRAEARALADRGQFEGAAAVLRELIRAIESEPDFNANDGSPLAEALEQLVDEAVAMERKPSAETYKAFRRAQTVAPMMYEAPAVSDAAPLSRHAISSVAGALPKARLVVVEGGAVGTSFALDLPRAVIGRTPSADIRIQDANVSRHHATILGIHERFFVADMASTNPTLVNGAALREPWQLANGDRIQVGDVVLRYEEG
jgi:Ca-activated chloride channel homolog